MKKILFSIMLLFCATAVMAQDELGFIPVSNAQELLDAVKSNLSSDGKISYAKIQLTDDIYLSELPEGTLTLNNTFSGTIDGSYWEYDEEEGEVIQKGYTIYGGHRNGSRMVRNRSTIIFRKNSIITPILFRVFRAFRVRKNHQIAMYIKFRDIA